MVEVFRDCNDQPVATVRGAWEPLTSYPFAMLSLVLVADVAAVLALDLTAERI